MKYKLLIILLVSVLFFGCRAEKLISDENVAYFQLKNSRYFKTPDFFNKKCNISFDPYINLLMGTRINAEISNETFMSISPIYRRRGTTAGDTTLTTYTTTEYSRNFDMLEIDFGFPVALNTDFMTIEAEASYILPVNSNESLFAPEGFIFMLSCFFKIF